MDGKWEAPLIKNPKCEKSAGCGKWTPPMIKNPEYKGKWKAPMINNPAYQGKWLPRRIPNPEYFELTSAFEELEPIGAIGLELWTMTDGIAFDNFLIVDDKVIADTIASATWSPKSSAEHKRSSKGSIVANLLQTANDKPWLWAVFILVILIPIVLITIFCCSGSSKDKEALQKKTDSVTPDDPDNEEMNREDSGNVSDNAQPEAGGETTPVAQDSVVQKSGSKKSPSSKKAIKKADLEEKDSILEEELRWAADQRMKISETGQSKAPLPKRFFQEFFQDSSESDDDHEPESTKSASPKKESSNSPRRRSARKAD
uniref:Calnexin n=1 Tax=Romanomermis culicivorax TaxID=13658 RepID=A0A915JB46_ROMCU